jgi:hypothetical protein
MGRRTPFPAPLRTGFCPFASPPHYEAFPRSRIRRFSSHPPTRFRIADASTDGFRGGSIGLVHPERPADRPRTTRSRLLPHFREARQPRRARGPPALSTTGVGGEAGFTRYAHQVSRGSAPGAHGWIRTAEGADYGRVMQRPMSFDAYPGGPADQALPAPGGRPCAENPALGSASEILQSTPKHIYEQVAERRLPEGNPAPPRSVIPTERPPDTRRGPPDLARDRGIYFPFPRGLPRCPGLALSGCFAAAVIARAAASGRAPADSRFVGPATRGVTSGYSVAGPRNDSSPACKCS